MEVPGNANIIWVLYQLLFVCLLTNQVLFFCIRFIYLVFVWIFVKFCAVEVLLGCQFELIAQACVFTLYQWRPQRGWLMMSLLYFCHTFSWYVTSLIHTGHKMAAFMVLFSWLSKVCVLTNRSRNLLMKYWGSLDKACCVSLIHFPFNVGCWTCIHSHDSIGLQVYCMDRPVRGICLMLSNQFFKEARANNVELADREGTAKDSASLDNLFRQLGFRIITKVNLNAQVRGFDNFH